MSNKTREMGIVTPVTANHSAIFGQSVAGQEGYEIILLEKISNGTIYRRTLYPGQTTSISENFFGRFEPLAVDMRIGHRLLISDTVTTSDHATSMSYTIELSFKVSDSYTVACEVVDPVQNLIGLIHSALADFMQVTHYSNITEPACKRVVRGVNITDTGLEIVSVETAKVDFSGRPVREIEHDDKIWEAEKEQELIEAENRKKLIEARAEIAIQQMKEMAALDIQQKKLQLTNLQDLDVRERDMMLDIIEQAIRTQLANGEIDAQEATVMIQTATDSLRATQATDYSNHIVFGPSQPAKQISSGDDEDDNSAVQQPGIDLSKDI